MQRTEEESDSLSSYVQLYFCGSVFTYPEVSRVSSIALGSNKKGRGDLIGHALEDDK